MTLEKEVQLNRPGHVTVYSNSQAALQAIQNADPLAAQGIFIRIFNTVDSLASRGLLWRRFEGGGRASPGLRWAA